MNFLTLLLLWGSLAFGQVTPTPDLQRPPERAPSKKELTQHPHSPSFVHQKTFHKAELRSFAVDLFTHRITLEIQITEPAGKVVTKTKYVLDPLECSLLNTKTQRKSYFEPPVGTTLDQSFDLLLTLSLGLTLVSEEGNASPVPLRPVQHFDAPIKVSH